MTIEDADFDRGELIKRAMQEEHAAIVADTPEAQASHRALAQLLRDRAAELDGMDEASVG